jgi:hypothetical protein
MHTRLLTTMLCTFEDTCCCFHYQNRVLLVSNLRGGCYQRDKRLRAEPAAPQQFLTGDLSLRQSQVCLCKVETQITTLESFLKLD